MPFTELGLSAPLLRAVTDLGFAAPTAIQQLTVAPILAGRDLQACAQTGSGKTAAYALPVLEKLQSQTPTQPRAIRYLVLVPTRELAAQVGAMVRSLSLYLHDVPKLVMVYGGVSINPQMLRLRGGADMVIATPGRLLDLVQHRALKLDQVQTLVLDEADRLLDQGFADELQHVLALLPQRRQNLMFSATFPAEVQSLADQVLHDAVRVAVEPDRVSPVSIEQRAILVDSVRRTALLRQLVEGFKGGRTLVFVATKHAATHVAEKLYRNGIYAVPFHGDLSQGARTQVLADFKSERWDIVVTTDLAARGIDIARLDRVINYDLPRSAVDYTHRIGRTGRAGASGLAISFVSPGTEAHLKLIEKRNGLSLVRETVEGFEPTDVVAPSAVSAGVGGIKGRRPSKKDKLRAAAGQTGG